MWVDPIAHEQQIAREAAAEKAEETRREVQLAYWYKSTCFTSTKVQILTEEGTQRDAKTRAKGRAELDLDLQNEKKARRRSEETAVAERLACDSQGLAMTRAARAYMRQEEGQSSLGQDRQF